ncbi:MAG: hypothetical protein LBI36_06610 [Oscillospiraceae bacterium]|jgi:hypothetical protein|nr:hypothetical protein [Oscillospiraceae bacterium]
MENSVNLRREMVDSILKQSKEISEKINHDIQVFFQLLRDLMLENTVKGVWGGRAEFPIKNGVEDGNEFVIIENEDGRHKFFVDKLCHFAEQEEIIVSETGVIFSNNLIPGEESGKNFGKFSSYGRYVEFIADFFTPAKNENSLKSEILAEFERSKPVYETRVRDVCGEIFDETRIMECFGYKAKYYKDAFPANLAYSFVGEHLNPISVPARQPYTEIVISEAEKRGINITEIEDDGMYSSIIRCALLVFEEKMEGELAYVGILRQQIKEAQTKYEKRVKAVEEKREEISAIFGEILPKVKEKFDKTADSNGKVYVVFSETDNPEYIVCEQKIYWELHDEFEKRFEKEGFKMGCGSDTEHYINCLAISRLS